MRLPSTPVTFQISAVSSPPRGAEVELRLNHEPLRPQIDLITITDTELRHEMQAIEISTQKLVPKTIEISVKDIGQAAAIQKISFRANLLPQITAIYLRSAPKALDTTSDGWSAEIQTIQFTEVSFASWKNIGVF